MQGKEGTRPDRRVTEEGARREREGPHLRILFVCVENSFRSQMAEAFARRLGGDRVLAYSAGSRPSGRVHPRAVAAMRERGIDLTGHRSKSVLDVPDEPFDAVVSMGCGDACPWVPARRRLEWEIPDPSRLPDDQLRAARDRIEREVEALLSELLSQSGAEP